MERHQVRSADSSVTHVHLTIYPKNQLTETFPFQILYTGVLWPPLTFSCPGSSRLGVKHPLIHGWTSQCSPPVLSVRFIPCLHSALSSTVKLDTTSDTTEDKTSDEKQNVKIINPFQDCTRNIFEHCLETKSSIQPFQGATHPPRSSP